MMIRLSRHAAMALSLSLASFGTLALAHDHHEGGESHIPEGEAISLEPIVSRQYGGREKRKTMDN